MMERKLIKTEPSRREFTKALTTGSLAAGLTSAAGFNDSTVQAFSSVQFDGTLSTDYATRALYAMDFGNIVHEVPMAVLKPMGGFEQISDKSYRDYLYRLGNVPWGGWQPAITQMIPASATPAFLKEALPIVTPANASESVTIELFAWKTSLFQRPLFRAPEEEHIFGVGIIRASRDLNSVGRMLSENQTLLEKRRAVRSTFYRFIAAVQSRHDWKLHYGPYWEDLVNAKHYYDPFRVIASGPDIFL